MYIYIYIYIYTMGETNIRTAQNYLFNTFLINYKETYWYNSCVHMHNVHVCKQNHENLAKKKLYTILNI